MTEKQYGPSWQDAAMELRRLRNVLPPGTIYTLTPTASRDGQWGIVFTIETKTSGTVLGACGYGRAYPNGAATVPAAILHACIKAEREWTEAQERVKRYLAPEDLAPSESDDVPF